MVLPPRLLCAPVAPSLPARVSAVSEPRLPTSQLPPPPPRRPTSLCAQAGCSPALPQLGSNNTARDSGEQRERLAEADRKCPFQARREILSPGAASSARRLPLPGPASPLRQGRLGHLPSSPPPPPTALPSLLGLARRVRSAAHRRRHVQRGALRGAE